MIVTPPTSAAEHRRRLPAGRRSRPLIGLAGADRLLGARHIDGGAGTDRAIGCGRTYGIS